MFDEGVDIWGMGCVLFELVSGEKAFREDWYVKDYTRQNEKLRVPLQPFVEAGIRGPLTNLVHEMLELVPDRRPRAHDLRSIFDDVIESGSFGPRSEDEAAGLYSRICQPSVNPTRAGPSRSIVFSVSYERNPYFSGRDDFLDRLFHELNDEQPRRHNHRIALYGLGGVGKTQTALEYAYRHQEDYAYVFWVSGVNRAELFSGFHGIAKIVRCALSFTRLEDIAKKVLHWLQVNENWLLIIDSLDDAKVISGYLPQSNGSGHVIITTRNTNTDDIPATGLEVSEMDHDTSVSFLLERIHVAAPSLEILIEAGKIVEGLGRLPLAVEQAAGYIKTPDNISTFLPIFDRFRQQFLRRRLPANHVYSHTVATTWNLSFERLAESYSVAASLLAYLAFMNPDEVLVDYLKDGATGFPQALQSSISDPFEWNQALSALEEFSLIRVFGKERSKLRIHRLVQAVIQDGLEKSKRCAVESAVIQIGLASFPMLHEDLKERDKCRRFRSQVTVCLEQTKGAEHKALWTDLAERMAHYLFLEGMYADASQWWGTISSIRKEVSGEEHPDTLRSDYELARSWKRQGQIKDTTLALAHKTLVIRRRVLGAEHPDTLKSMDSVAESYGMLGQYQEAADLVTETLELRKRVLRAEHPDILQSMNSLAVSYDNLGRFQRAADLKAETLTLRKRVLGAEHPDTLESMNDLAVSYDNLGQFKRAAALKAETLKLKKRVLGAEHPDTLQSMNNLAVSYDRLGQFKEAADLDAETLKLKKRVLGAEHPDTLRSMSNLAVAYDKLGQFERAADLKAETLKLRERVLEPKHPDILRSMHHLAVSYDKLGQFERAADLKTEALRLRKEVLGAKHPDTLQSMNSLAVSYDNLGQFERAADLKAETVELKKRVLGAEHPDTLESMNDLALTYDHLGQFEKAADLRAETLKLRKRALEAERPDTPRAIGRVM